MDMNKMKNQTYALLIGVNIFYWFVFYGIMKNYS
jgi:hypothetical protein